MIKKRIIIFITFLFFSAIALQISGNNHIYRTLAMTIFRGKLNPDILELNEFPSRKIISAAPQPWHYSQYYQKLPLDSALRAEALSFESTAYLVIQNDSLLYEEYFEGFDSSTVSNSFSMAKSFTSLLIGKAIQEGFIHSIDDYIYVYLPQLNYAPYNEVRIKDLLTMSSGLDFNESYGSPFGWPAKAYYGTDVNATILNAPRVHPAGKVYEYKGGDTQLLGMILQSVLKGKNVSDYAAELWQTMGAENTAYWSLDKPEGMEKVSCCYYATARDFARFGKLMMQGGKWNGIQIIDSAFVWESKQLAQTVTTGGEANTQYGFQWWIMKHRNHDIFYARGIRGQYIFCIPEINMIIVRLGHKRASKKGDALPDDIYTYLNGGLNMAAH